jgi:putative FmdB family regulatory protein
MPTYVYACDTCQVQFEQFQSFHDEPLRTCPECQSAVRRVLQPAGIVFKGSGWHINDYRNTPKESSDTPAGTPAATPAADASAPASAATPAPAANSPAAAPAATPAPASAPSSSTDA